MRNCLNLGRIVLAACMVATVSGVAVAQVGRVGGSVTEADGGKPIVGATVTGTNPNQATVTATTDAKGRFSLIGLRSGNWSFTAEAPGYSPETGSMNVSVVSSKPNPLLTFALRKGGGFAGDFAGLT